MNIGMNQTETETEDSEDPDKLNIFYETSIKRNF